MDTNPEYEVICEKCGYSIQIGDFPFCKGTPESHQRHFMRSGNGVFPFTVNHVDGKPMVIESLNQLRGIEKTYGVVFSAFSRDNWQDCAPTDSNPPKIPCEDPYVRRDNPNRY